MPLASRTPRLLWLTVEVAAAAERLRTPDYRLFRRARRNAEQRIREDVLLYATLGTHFHVYKNIILFIEFDQEQSLFYVNAFMFGAEGLNESERALLGLALTKPTPTASTGDGIAAIPSEEPTTRGSFYRLGLRAKVQAPIKWMVIGWKKSRGVRLPARPRGLLMLDACRTNPNARHQLAIPPFSPLAHSDIVVSKPELFSAPSDDITLGRTHLRVRSTKRSLIKTPLVVTSLISVTRSSKKIDERVKTHIVVGFSAGQPATSHDYEQQASAGAMPTWWQRLYNAGL